jgi:hypothetical protein
MALLQELAGRLVVPGLPDWTGLVALLLLLLVVLAYMLMPFAVFGVKGRLDVIEAQLDDLQAEIRGLALRLSDAPRRAIVSSDEWMDAPPVAARRASSSMDEQPTPRQAPPVPPPAAWPEGGRSGGGRTEPRLDWPGGGRPG